MSPPARVAQPSASHRGQHRPHRYCLHPPEIPICGATVDNKYADPANPWPGLLKFVVAVGFLYSLLNFFGVIHMVSGGVIGDERSTMQLMPEEEAPEAEAAPEAAPAPAAAPAP